MVAQSKGPASAGQPSSRATKRRITRARAVVALVLTLAVGALTACGSGDDETKAGGPVTITCVGCEKNPTDPALSALHTAAERFNKQYAGRYKVKTEGSKYAAALPDRAQYYVRRALANDLPDVFLLSGAEAVEVSKSGKLVDLRPILDEDPAWLSTFYPGSFYQVENDGEVLGIPQDRNAIGVWYNKALLRDAGVDALPETWDAMTAACERIKASGKFCFGMDGDWVTLLWWANLIGTQPGGPEFLNDEIKQCEYAENPAVIRATEQLKDWHARGFVNPDAFSGDFTRADTPFVEEDAAFLANGPWEVAFGIKAEQANDGLYERVGYGPSPGWTPEEHGTMVIAGEGVLVTSSQDEAKLEAVIEFMKFVTREDQQLSKIRDTGTFTAVKTDFSDAEKKTLEPLALNLNEQVEALPATLNYPHAWTPKLASAWKNLWPAYAEGDIDTSALLDRLVQDGCPTRR